MRLTPLLLALALMAPATAQAGNVCLTASHIDHTYAPSDDTLLVYMQNREIWKNTLKAPCQGLKFENAIKWEIRGDEVCSNMQSFSVLHQGNFCFFGEFTRYTPPPKQAP